jgi:hypothetical protein
MKPVNSAENEVMLKEATDWVRKGNSFWNKCKYAEAIECHDTALKIKLRAATPP